MFQNTIIEIIKRVENLTQNKRSIIELDIKDIKEKIQETLFNINFTEDEIEEQDTVNTDALNEFNITAKEAFGLFFLTFVGEVKNRR